MIVRMETNEIVQDNNSENVLVQNLLNDVKQCPQDYLSTEITGAIVRRIYISIRKVFTQPKLYDIDCTYRIIVTGGYILSTTFDYQLLEFKLIKNIINSL
jgi:hypothetical protein